MLCSLIVQSRVVRGSVVAGGEVGEGPRTPKDSVGKLSRGFGEGVVEVVGMLAVGDVDGHFTG